MLVDRGLAVKTVGFARDGNAANLADLHQSVEVTVHGAETQARTIHPQGGADLLGRGVVGAAEHFAQDQFPLV